MLTKKIYNGKQLYTLTGYTVAGKKSCIVLPDLDIVFDMGHCPDIAVKQSLVLITHGHYDHIGCLHMHTFERRLVKLSSPTYAIPYNCIEYFEKVYELSKMLNRPGPVYKNYNINCINNESKSFYHNNLLITPLKTDHTIESYGYVISKIKKKLKPEFSHLSSEDIKQIAMKGITVSHEISDPIIGYTGDTTIEGVIKHKLFLNVNTLIMECSFIGDTEKEQEFAKTRGHICLNDIIINSDKFNNKNIVLCHISSRYTHKQINYYVNILRKIFGERINIIPFI